MFGGKSPTEILRAEHENVLQKLDALEEVINYLEKKEAVSTRLKELASFFDTDFLVHFSKEEDALFPELEMFIPREHGPVGVMLIEHEELKKTNAEFQRGLSEYLGDSGGLEGRIKIQRYGAHFIGVLRDHIDKEDNILFMMADMHLDPEQRNKVLRLFAEIEKQKEKKSS